MTDLPRSEWHFPCKGCTKKRRCSEWKRERGLLPHARRKEPSGSLMPGIGFLTPEQRADTPRNNPEKWKKKGAEFAAWLEKTEKKHQREDEAMKAKARKIDFGDKSPHLRAVPDDEPLETPALLLNGLKTGDWLDNQTFDPLRYVVPGLIPEGMTLLIGGPKIGKSWLSLDIALATSSGGKAVGCLAVGKPRPVFLLALEDGDRRLQGRIRKLLPDGPIPHRLHYMTKIQHGEVVATIRAWFSGLTDDEKPLVILDTLGKIMPPALKGETTYQRDYRVAGELKRVCDERPGTALLVLHHDRKSESDDFVDSVSGTNGIAGAADTIVVIKRKRNEIEGLLQVTGRDVREDEYAVSVEDGAWRLTGDDLTEASSAATTVKASSNLGDRAAEIVGFIGEYPEGVRAGEVADNLGMPPNEAGVYLSRLLKAGRVRRPSRGLYAPVTR